MYDANGKPVLSPAAILDEAADRAAHEKCAMDLRANEWKPPAPAPKRDHLGPMLYKLGRMVAAELKPLRQRLAELEAREWVGIWTSGKAYAKNAIVSHDGSCWLATREFPEGKPGAGPACGWRLIVKRGRDGKDATK